MKPTSTVTLKPTRAGLIVRDPKTGAPLPEAGGPVVLNTYWNRRLRDGSVEQVKATTKSTPKT